ncbi:MAG: asparagine synthase (glutamine-hydrolyzing) [Rhodospirillales bacterium]|nr:asparagine synthase (glutamine-hydrolyzing) [Rhodospirillales bacterium]
MCGIAGFTRHRTQAEAAAALTDMRERLRHRGPDAQANYCDGRIALTHTRLAVVDLCGGAQPRVDADGSALTFNGEIYGFAEHAAELRQAGVELQDRSDTEVLFQMLRRNGVEATLQRIDGMFAFAYRDPDGAVWLARDRFGEKPLFYAEHGGDLYFASELAALRAHPDLAGWPWNERSLRLFLALQYLPAPDSGIAGIKKLPPGTMLKFCNGQSRLTRYWHHPRSDSAPVASLESHVERLDDLLLQSVRDRLVADVPVGIFLSGGLDSSLVAAYAKRCDPNVHSFSIKFEDASFDESSHAEAAARHLALRHRTIPVGRDAIVDAFDGVLARLDEPMADASILPTYLLSQVTREHVTVALGGDGADELFLGYPNFMVRRYAGMMSLLPSALGAAVRKVLSALPATSGYMNWPFKFSQLSFGFGRPPEVQSLYWMSGLAATDQSRVWPGGNVDQLLASQFEVLAGECWGESDVDAVGILARLFLRGYLPDSVLTKVDRASMYHALEVRAPFLSKAIGEFALSLPTGFKLRHGTGKYILRRLARRYLPSDIVMRGKHGFAVPLASLFRGRLRGRIGELVLEASGPIHDALHRPALEKLLRDHWQGRHDNSRQIWTLCVLAAVTRART